MGFRRNESVKGPHDAAEAGQSRSRNENAHEKTADAIAQGFHHLRIFDASPNEKADPGPVEHEMHRPEHQQANRHRDDAVAFDGNVAEHEGAAKRLREGDRDGRSAPDGMDQLLGDDKAADRHENLLQMASIDRSHDDPLEQKPRRSRDRHGGQDAQSEQSQIQGEGIRLAPCSEGSQDQQRRIGSERDEDAMAEIDDVHEAKDEREA